jgi:HD superfamily phosphohydrolase
MRELLSEAIERIEKLPADLQDEIAKQIMDDLESERRWEETLGKPQKKIERLAEKALQKSDAKREKT